MTKTIILFDSWSFGFKYFEYYVPYLKDAGFNVVFATMDNVQYRTLSDEKSEELLKYSNYVKSKLDVYDVSSNIGLETLKNQYPKPSLIIHLSISHLENRLLNLIYRDGPIITYIQHGNIFGLEGAKNTIESQSKLKAIFNRTFIFKLLKFLRLFNLYYKRASLSEFFVVLSHWLSGPRQFVWLPKNHISISIDSAFAFSEQEKIYLSNLYGISIDDIKVIVNPEIYSLGGSSVAVNGDFNNLIFIDQALVESGLLSNKDQNSDYEQCEIVASKFSLDFKVRLHPRALRERLGDTIKVCDEPLVDMVNSRNIYVGYNSSLMKTLVILGFPVIHLKSLDGFRAETIMSNEEIKEYKNNYYIADNKEDLSLIVEKIISKFDRFQFKKINDPGKILLENIIS